MKYLYNLLLTLLFTNLCFAESGMLIPSRLATRHKVKLEKAGLQIPVSQIYNHDTISLKDAVLGISYATAPFSFVGTASFISDSGLVITNQHTIVKAATRLAKTDRNIIQEGFFASSDKEEINLKGLMLSRLVFQKNVTSEMHQGLPAEMDAKAYKKYIRVKSKEIVKKYSRSSRYKGRVKTFFSGNQYYIELYEQYKDIRLVAVPSIDLAKFGGDKDNWQWPRQSADFSFLRVYRGNKKLNSPNYFKVSTKTIAENDFSMLLGFPASSKQYIVSDAIQQIENVVNNHSVKIYESLIDVLNKAKNPKAKKFYTSTIASFSNRLLRMKAENRGFEKYNLIGIKKEEERVLVEKFPQSQIMLDSISSYIQQLNEYELANAYLLATGVNGAEIISFAAKFEKLQLMGTKFKAKKKQNQREIKRLKSYITKFFKNFYPHTQKQYFAKCIELYYHNVPEKFHSPELLQLANKYKQNFAQLAEEAFKTSVFTNELRMSNFLDSYTNEDAARITMDPIFQLALSYYITNAEKIAQQRMKIRKKYAASFKELVRMKIKSGINYGPDANRTLRLSFGSIKALGSDYFTDSQSLLSKIKSGNSYYSLKKTNYATVKAYSSTKPICFINHFQTTGGNSGSAVLNAKGELTGIYFDRNTEAVIANYGYMPTKARGIATSIQYIKHILQHSNSNYLLNEIPLAD